MTVPTAPMDSGGTKLMFLLADDSGNNVAALFRAIGAELLNGERVAHLGIATHVDGETFGTSDQLVAIGGVNEGVVRKILVDSQGRPIGRPLLAYDGGSVPAFAHQRAIGQASLEGEQAAHAAVASHQDGATFAASDPVMLLAGVTGTTLKRLAVDSSGRAQVVTEPTFSGARHKNVQSNGVAVPLIGSATPCRRVRVKADAANGAIIYLGGSAVTNDETEATGGYQLEAGDEVLVEVADVATLYINGTAGQGVSYFYWT